MTPTWIAEERVIFVHPDGRRSPGRIAVGLPVQVDPAESTCPIALDGFHTIPRPIHGGSNLQALMLAVRFLGMRIHDFLSKGGRVLDPDDDTDMQLQAFFGRLLADPDPTG